MSRVADVESGGTEHPLLEPQPPIPLSAPFPEETFALAVSPGMSRGFLVEPVTQTLAELIRLNSVNPEWGGPGEGAVAAFVKDFFQRAAIEVWEEAVLPGRSNVMARLPGDDPRRRVVLEAHMDTVSAKAMAMDPFDPVIESNRMRGRGSCDVKAGLAAMMHALRDVKAAGRKPPCEIVLAAVVDEEHLFRGVVSLVESLGRGSAAEAAVVAEPTGLRVVRANKGVVRWRVVTKGKACHSSQPNRGQNAIAGMARVVLALQEHFASLECSPHALLGAATGSIGTIEGGTQVNFVPDRCEIKIDRRLLPGESAPHVLAQCEEVLRGLRMENPRLLVTMEPPDLVDEAMETPAGAEVVQVATRIADRLGLDGNPIGVPFGCDSTKLSRAGIPSIVFGPGSIDRAHTPEEYVELDQVETAVEFYRRFVLEFWGA